MFKVLIGYSFKFFHKQSSTHSVNSTFCCGAKTTQYW